MELELRGKVAVITGGSIGIGLAVAEALALEGVDLLLCARDETRVTSAAAAIQESHGVRALGIAADVATAVVATASLPRR